MNDWQALPALERAPLKLLRNRSELRSISIWVSVALALFVAWLLYPRSQRADSASGVKEAVCLYVAPVSDAMRAAIDEFERDNPQYHIVTGAATARDNTGDPTRFLLSVAGSARPSRTWEEICRKLVHATGTVSADGTVNLTDFVRRLAVNSDIAPDARPDLAAAGVRPGDVVCLVAGTTVFRGRILDLDGPSGLVRDSKARRIGW
jgi:hypothetical protein